MLIPVRKRLKGVKKYIGLLGNTQVSSSYVTDQLKDVESHGLGYFQNFINYTASELGNIYTIAIEPPLGCHATTARVRPFSGLIWAT